MGRRRVTKDCCRVVFRLCRSTEILLVDPIIADRELQIEGMRDDTAAVEAWAAWI